MTRLVSSRLLFCLLLAAPVAWWLHAWQTGAMIYGELLHASGEWSARLLIVALAVTPLRRLMPRATWPRWLLERRRYVGVAVFGYALLHVVVYVARKKSPGLIVAEGADISLATGWLALLLLLLLAVTSNDASVRRLRRGWRRLHSLVYPAALLTFLHWFLAAYDYVPALWHAATLGALQLLRVLARRRGRESKAP